MNKIVEEILARRGITTKAQVDKFLHPSLDDMRDPMLLSGMRSAKERIQSAIKNHETIVIYGDYDADGVCSVSILYLYLKSQGLEPIVFIPSRHTDGYGLSADTVEKLVEEFMPDLVITVDTGISARAEVELLQELGVDVIVTDHHEVPAEAPECIVVDPKQKGQEYGFDGLSGAGVALKVVEALAGRREAIKYLDICAISTIGDIVPLLDENRVITKFGLDAINGKNPRPSIAHLKKKLGLKTLNSTDVSFKIVPRINASGRMSSAYKCFEYLTATDPQILDEKFAEIEADNDERLKQLNEVYASGVEANLDINAEPIIFLKKEKLNLGLIGIVASKLCGNYNRPVFVFAEDENGRLKGSVRSVEGFDIFNILSKNKDLTIDVGGHALAGGLTIEKGNYEAFKSAVMQSAKEFLLTGSFEKPMDFDAEITEDYINLDFAREINMLEPFGHQNPKPKFLLKAPYFSVSALKSYKHFKLLTPKHKEVMCFFGGKYLPIFDGNWKPQVVVELAEDEYLGKPQLKAIALDIKPTGTEFEVNEDAYMFESLANATNMASNAAKTYVSVEELQELLTQKYGVLVLAQSKQAALELTDKYNLTASPILPSSGKSIVLTDLSAIESANIALYSTVIVLDSLLTANQFCAKNRVVFARAGKKEIDVQLNRTEFAGIFVELKKLLPFSGNTLYEVVSKLSAKLKNLDKQKIFVAVLACIELGFFKWENETLSVADIKTKKDLSSSQILNLTNRG